MVRRKLFGYLTWQKGFAPYIHDLPALRCKARVAESEQRAEQITALSTEEAGRGGENE